MQPIHKIIQYGPKKNRTFTIKTLPSTLEDWILSYGEEATLAILHHHMVEDIKAKCKGLPMDQAQRYADEWKPDPPPLTWISKPFAKALFKELL